jgi:hypothetical protein
MKGYTSVQNVTKYKTRDQRKLCEPEQVVTTILSHFQVKIENKPNVNYQKSKRYVTVL